MSVSYIISCSIENTCILEFWEIELLKDWQFLSNFGLTLRTNSVLDNLIMDLRKTFFDNILNDLLKVNIDIVRIKLFQNILLKPYSGHIWRSIIFSNDLLLWFFTTIEEDVNAFTLIIDTNTKMIIKWISVESIDVLHPPKKHPGANWFIKNMECLWMILIDT